MDPKQRIEQIKRNLVDATSLREPEKVPVSVDMCGFAFRYAGVRYADVIDDTEACAKAFCKVFNEIPLDISCSNELPMPPLRSYEALGSDRYMLSSDGDSVTHNQTEDAYCGPEVYDEVLADPMAVSARFIKSHYPAFSLPEEEAYEKLKEAAVCYRHYLDTNAFIRHRMVDEFGILEFYGDSDEMGGVSVGYSSSLCQFFDVYRGIKNTLADLRRRPEKVRAACEKLWQDSLWMYQTDLSEAQPLPFSMSIFHPEAFLSPAQFDEYYFKHFIEAMMPIAEAGNKILMYGEGDFLRHLDRFREMPEGSMVFILDATDPFEAYKIIGDRATIIAGMKISLMQLGTREQNLDYLKRCFETFAPGGGFICGPDKELLGGNDAKVENFRAVFELADELSRQY